MIKKALIVITALIVWSQNSHAQDSLASKPDSIYTTVDVMPEFPGGRKAMARYVDGKNHRYPKEAREHNIEGTVMIEFVINKDGSLSDFKVVKGIGYGCDEAAVEAFKKMPNWKPAMVNGIPVRFRVHMGYLYGL